MYKNKWFINVSGLPGKLSSEETISLLERIQKGDKDALNVLVEHNIRFVIHILNEKFSYIDDEKEDFISVGIIGLMKASLTFDLSRNVKFSTYAGKCIQNEILMFLKSIKESMGVSVLSLDFPLLYQDDENNMTLMDTIKDETDWFYECENESMFVFINEFLSKLSEFDRKMVMMNFGFIDGKIYSQRQIGNMVGLSQSSVCRRIERVLEELKIELVRHEFIEHRSDKQKLKTITHT